MGAPVNGTAEHKSQTAGDNAEREASASHKGVVLKRKFTIVGEHPFEAVTWDRRDVSILDDRGEAIFSQKDVEVPAFWSQTALTVVASKYFAGEHGTAERESSIRTLIGRVVETITSWGIKQKYFADTESSEAFKAELTYILLNQYASFNSPVWFNVGVREHPQCSACFILSVDDTMDSLLELQTREGKLFKWGSGTGSNLSSIRSSKEKLAGGGVPSGPVSFMKAYDAWANIIKSGGKTRRAAKMQILNVEHPDIEEFVDCKQEEEKKAWALIEQGYDPGFAVPGGAYDSVSFQNANLSVRVSDDFMRAAVNDEPYWTKNVMNGEPCEQLSARKVLEQIAEGTHICGDPGIQFDTTINDWHTCPATGRINASNPCSEYMHLDNSACNLSSINLLKFLEADGSFNTEEFRHVVDVMITAQDILIDNASYPFDEVAKCAHEYRQLGLGYANLGAFLMSKGLPYDSEQGREWAAVLTALMTGQAYETSAKLAAGLKPFSGYKKNRKPMLDVIRKHRDALSAMHLSHVPTLLREEAAAVWEDALSTGEVNGYRNSQATVLAPTGTISFMMDCDTTGIEPDIALVKYKKLVGGGMLKLVNNSVARGLKELQYSEESIREIIAHIEEHDTIEGAPGLKHEHLAVFDCAFRPANGERSIDFMGHLGMMAAAQPFLSGAISKTVNLPRDCTPADIFKVYVAAWEMGLKAVALYRDGSKRTQPLSTDKGSPAHLTAQPVRRRLPDERSAVTHKFSVGGLEGYLTVGLYDDGSPGEIFLVVAKEGSTLSGVMDALATSISIALQYGVPLETLVKKFSHMRFEPSGFTHNKDIPLAKSVIDYVFRWMGSRFLSEEKQRAAGLLGHDSGSNESSRKAAASESAGDALTFQNMEDAPPCTSCGSSLMVRQGSCYVCLNCGAQGGCG